MDAIVVAVIAALAALGGAAIGALATIFTMRLQTETAARTERVKQVVQLAIEDLKVALEQGRHEETPKGGKVIVRPLVGRLQYYKDVLDAIERGQLTNARFQEIRARSNELGELAQSEP
jgi:hypothetical protein